MTPDILIGTAGWEHDDWIGEFYPEELPPEWRFCYYSNAMRAVLVPHTAWAASDAHVLAQWAADSDPAFRFVVELPLAWAAARDSARAAVGEFMTQLTPLARQVAGCLVRCDLARWDMAALTATVDTVAAHYPVCVEWPQHEPRPVIATSRELGSVWDADREDGPMHGGSLLIARSAGGNPRALRAVLEKIAAANAKQGALFIKPSPQAMRVAQQARSLAEMMGI